MSSVYRALKKAEREGRWQAEQPAAEQDAAARSDQGRAGASSAAAPALDAGANGAAQAAPDAAEGGSIASAGRAAPEGIDTAERASAAGAVSEETAPVADATPAREIRVAVPPAGRAPTFAPGAEEVRAAPDGANSAAIPVEDASGHHSTGLITEWWRMLTQADHRPDDDAPTLVAAHAPTSPAAEKFQLLRVWFENWTATNHKRVMLVSSALPGEGKSFVSLNLAVTLANAGYRVLLVDADLRRPCLHRAFNLVPMHGLLDYLERRAEFAECLSRVPGLPMLTLVAAGGVTGNASELVAGRMGEFVAQARALEPPHYVLIDAPAALATPETEILAGVVDAALMVVAANHTPRQMVRQACELLRNTTTCGVVMNRFEPAYSTSRKVVYGYYGQPAREPTSGLY